MPLNKIGMTNADYLAIFQQVLLPMAYEVKILHYYNLSNINLSNIIVKNININSEYDFWKKDHF